MMYWKQTGVKLDENKQETDIVNVIPPELTPLNNNEIDFF